MITQHSGGSGGERPGAAATPATDADAVAATGAPTARVGSAPRPAPGGGRSRRRGRPRAGSGPRGRRRHGPRDWLLSENRRVLLSLVLAFAVGVLALLAYPQLNWVTAPPTEQVSRLLLIVIVVLASYSLLFAASTYLALDGQPRARLVAVARLPRVRKHVRWYRWSLARSGPASEVTFLLLTAGIAVVLLVIRPADVPVLLLLVLTIISVVTAWIGSVVTFAVEYAAEDCHGDAFHVAATPGPRRTLSDYAYAAVVVQASSGPSDMTARTTSARALVRTHVLLAHFTSAILITLGVSAILTALG